jgi:hypothetical protein
MKKLSKSKIFLTSGFIIFLSALLTSCSGYGKLVQPASCGMNVAIDELVENSKQYDVFYSGTESCPCAVLFDPKDDPNTIQTSCQWKPVDELAMLYRIINSMRENKPEAARLRVIQGKDNVLYGFIFTFGEDTVKHVGGGKHAVEVYPFQSATIKSGGGRTRGGAAAGAAEQGC